MREHKTIPPDEVTRTINLKTKDLHYYKDLFQRILIGRKADLEFDELQNNNESDYVSNPEFRAQLEWRILFFSERLELIDHELNNRGMKKPGTSLN